MILLPPILYGAGVGMSWRGFRANLRPILLLAVGCIIFTTTAVAVVAHYVVGLPWAVAFVLGATVSPPDAVAPMAVLRALRLPRHLIMVLEGESPVNDATVLVTLSFAVAAVASGGFSATAASQFTAIVVAEIAFGLAVGWGDAGASTRRRRSAGRGAARGCHPVCGLLAAPPGRLRGGRVRRGRPMVSLNGRAPDPSGDATAGLLHLGSRHLWCRGAYLRADPPAGALGSRVPRRRGLGAAANGRCPRLRNRDRRALHLGISRNLSNAHLARAIGRREPLPNWRSPFLLSFVGLRRVVSLAAALSIPFMVNGPSVSGARPHPVGDLLRHAVTLIGVGATLPGVVRGLGLAHAGLAEAEEHKRAERAARLEGIDALLAGLDRAAAKGAPESSVAAMRRRHNDRRRQLGISADERTDEDPVGDTSVLELELVEIERKAIARAYAENRLTDEARRRIEREFDLEEARIRHAAESAAPPAGDPAGRDEAADETATQSP